MQLPDQNENVLSSMYELSQINQTENAQEEKTNSLEIPR